MSPDEQPHPRIGYVLKMYPRFSETFVVTELLALEEQGADIEIFSLRSPVDGRFHETLAQVRGPVTYVPQRSRSVDLWAMLGRSRVVLGDSVDRHLGDLLELDQGDASQSVEVAVMARSRGLTHLHAHFGTVAATVARMAARLAGIGYSMTLHAKDIYHKDVNETLLAAKIRDSRLSVTVSDYNLRFLRDRYAGASDRVTRIYNGIDLERFPFSSPRERSPLVVGVGRLVEKKGFRHLVDAIALLREHGVPARLSLVGDGDQTWALRDQVTALDLDGLVTFHGPQTQAETRDHLRRAAVMAAPCIIGADGNRDGLPTTILECLALGTPVVATPITGIPEAVVDGRTGLIVPEADVEALARALTRLLVDVELRCDLAEAGRDHVEALFDTRHNAKLLYDAMTTPLPERGA